MTGAPLAEATEAHCSTRWRLAIVSDAVWPFNPGGKEKRLHEIATRLGHRGVDVHVYTMQWWDGPRTLEQDGVTFHAISRLRPLYQGGRRSIPQAIVFGLATLRLLFEPFDLVDVDHMPFFPLFTARLVCALRGKRLVGTWHEVWGPAYWKTYLGPVGTIGWLMEWLSFRTPHHIIANSPHTSRRLAGYVRGTAVHAISLGVDFDHILTIDTGPEPSDVVFAGRLLPNKNVDLLLRAVALLAGHGRDVRVTIVGEGPERGGLELLARELGITGLVTFRDFFPDHDDLIAHIKASAVFVLPSQREGFGLVVLEANVCGVPVVTVDHPDNAARELIVEGCNGFVAALNEASLADAIMLALASGADMDTEAFARETFARYSWDAVAARVLEVLEPLVAGALVGGRREATSPAQVTTRGGPRTTLRPLPALHRPRPLDPTAQRGAAVAEAPR
ncbi:MAG: glycosyltransferase family 4 protein [Acidimicrobiales bacterium]